MTPQKKEWQPVFLEALRESANVSLAARRAGVSRKHAYDTKKRNKSFAADWRDALGEAVDALELEARRRAFDGLIRKKFDKGEPVIDPATGQQYVEREYSDTLMIFLLKAHRPRKFRETIRNEVSGINGGPITVVIDR